MRRLLAAGLVGALSMTVLAGCGGSGPPPGTGPVPTLGAGQSATVTYCNDQTARITEPKTRHGLAPAAVYVHGGAWDSGDDSDGGFIIDAIGPALVARGFVVVAINYRLGPGNRWPAQIEDVKCAVRYLRANAKALHVDPDEIGAWGHSAGGHLVALLGAAGPSAGWDVGAYTDQSSRVQAVADLAGVSDLRTLGSEGAAQVVEKSFIALLGPVPSDQLAAKLEAASPVTYVSRGDPPFLLVHADNDTVVPLSQSQELATALTASGVPNQLDVVHDGGHDLDQAGATPDSAQITATVVAFFVQHLEPG